MFYISNSNGLRVMAFTLVYIKGIVAWSAFQKTDFKHKLQLYYQTYIIFYYNK